MLCRKGTSSLPKYRSSMKAEWGVGRPPSGVLSQHLSRTAVEWAEPVSKSSAEWEPKAEAWERTFVRLHLTEVVPLVLGRVLDIERLPLGGRRLVNQSALDELVLLQCAGVGKSERYVEHGSTQRAPNVYELCSAAQEALPFLG